MAKKADEKLQLGFFGFESFKKPGSQIRPEIAAWWFGQMHQVVAAAQDHEVYPSRKYTSQGRINLPLVQLAVKSESPICPRRRDGRFGEKRL